MIFRIVTLFLIIISKNISAVFLTNDMVAVSKTYQYEGNTEISKSCGPCQSRMFYPELTNNDKILAAKINKKISNFVENNFTKCCLRHAGEYSLLYNIPDSNSDYFSVVFSREKKTAKINKKYKKAISFLKENGEPIHSVIELCKIINCKKLNQFSKLLLREKAKKIDVSELVNNRYDLVKMLKNEQAIYFFAGNNLNVIFNPYAINDNYDDFLELSISLKKLK